MALRATELPTAQTEWGYTVEEFMELPEPEDGSRYELIDGELIVSPQPGDQHGRISTRLALYVGGYVLQNKLGEVWTNGTFKLEMRTGLAPDVGFQKTENMSPLTRGAVPGSPDLAIEINSPSDRPSTVLKKVKKYQAKGVPLVWVVEPKNKTVAVYKLGQAVPTILQALDILDGGEVLPGFQILVNLLFE